MTTTIDEIIDSIESELTTELKGVQGIRDVFFDDNIPIVLNFPCVHMQLDRATLNNVGSQDPIDFGDWSISYDVACMFAGIEQEKTFRNARKFTDRVYEILRAQKDYDEFLSGNCIDIEIPEIVYGYIELGQFNDSGKNMRLKGGVIRLNLHVVEFR